MDNGRNRRGRSPGQRPLRFRSRLFGQKKKRSCDFATKCEIAGFFVLQKKKRSCDFPTKCEIAGAFFWIKKNAASISQPNVKSQGRFLVAKTGRLHGKPLRTYCETGFYASPQTTPKTKPPRPKGLYPDNINFAFKLLLTIGAQSAPWPVSPTNYRKSPILGSKISHPKRS